jgi:PknH-like extracellular domain
VTLNFGGYSSAWMAFGPSRADGVDVLLVRREGGRGYGCGRAIAARTNVTADVVVCGRDETVVNGQAAEFVHTILGRIPG